MAVIGVNQVSWGKYGGYEGPASYVRNFYTPPTNASFVERCLGVVASAEGALGAVNMYDRAIVSVGCIQWTELTDNKVSELVGFVAEREGPELVLRYLQPALDLSDGTFKQNAAGKYRFFLGDTEVKGEPLARKLFAGGSGPVGSWTDANRLRAKTWAAGLSSLFHDDAAVAAQVAFTAPQLVSRFVWTNGARHLFYPGSPETGYPGAVKALLVAYGVNLPAVADKTLAAALVASKYPKWSMEWCLDIIHGLAMTSGVSIWPGRYDSKRPALEKFFGIQLPKTSQELSKRGWQATLVSESKPIVEPAPVPEQPVVSQPKGPVSDGVLGTASEDVYERPLPVLSPEPTHPLGHLAFLQWLPMLFGGFWQLVNMLIHFLRGSQ